MSHETLQIIWFLLIAVLWTGYLVLEGFDFGVGMLLPFVPRDEKERRVAINTIGIVIRIPCSTARLSTLSHVPGRNADTCEEPLSAAKASAVVNAAPMPSSCVTARGPI